MLTFVTPFLVLTILVLILISGVVFGRRVAYSQLKHGRDKLEAVTVAESSVFGLLALLIAFTFSGAYERFENRKLHLVTEANAFRKAYDFIDLVPSQHQQVLRQELLRFMDLHIIAFQEIPHLNKVAQDLQQAAMVQDQLWENTVIACKDSLQQSLAQSVAEAMDDMFAEAFMGQKLTRIHPPAVIFLLMIGLAVLGAFLIGYDSAENQDKRHIHIVCYIIITAFTIFLIMNLEFPRTGFIRMTYFDKMLINVRATMQ